MSKIGIYYLIDNNENRIYFYGYESRCHIHGVLSQCVEYNYNVTADKILKFRWGTIEWDFAQLILGNAGTGETNRVVGFRLVLQSKFLNAYYKIISLIANQNELVNHCNRINEWKFDMKYEDNYNGYSITLDILHKGEEVYQGRKGTLFGKYKSDNI